MRKKIFVQVFFIALSFIVALVSTYPKVEVTKHSDLKNLSCGWPLKFVVHDDSLLDPPMPWKVSCGFLRGPYGQGSTKEFNWQYFILDAAFFYLLILALYHGKDLVIKKKQEK
ncbi:MAG: hypothetical protein Q8N37_01390 [bacterium]|nr:hypothetical protein [bacterium]